MNWDDLVVDLDMLKCTSCGIFWPTLDITSTCDNCKTLKGIQCEQLFNSRVAFVPITPPASSSEVQIDRLSLDSPSPFEPRTRPPKSPKYQCTHSAYISSCHRRSDRDRHMRNTILGNEFLFARSLIVRRASIRFKAPGQSQVTLLRPPCRTICMLLTT